MAFHRTAFAFVAALGLVLALASAARADRFIPIGARQRAMGNAGVASTEDATAIYWNPANLGQVPLGRPPYTWGASGETSRRGGADAPTGTAEPADEAAEELRRDKAKSEGRWAGYDDVQVSLAASLDFKLTGDIVARVDELDQLVRNADIEGAINRANTLTLNQQDFRNLVSFFEQVEDLDEGGDAILEAGGGAFVRYRGFGVAFYTNTYVGLLPTVTLLQKSGFSETASIDAIAAGLRAQGNIPPPQTAAGQAFQTELQNAGYAAPTAEAFARLAEESGADLSDPDLRAALRVAGQQSGGGAGTSLANNESGLRTNALSTQEIAFGFAVTISPWAPTDGISIGVAPKLMHGITGFEEVLIADVVRGNETFVDPIEEYPENLERTFQFGIDVGITLQIDWFRIGVTGRNLNEPEFDFKDGGAYRLERQFRAGVAVRPVPSFMISADVDLVRNESQAVQGNFTSQYVGGGVEWNPDWDFFGIAFRAGCYGDLEDERKRDGFVPVVTGGIGARFGVVSVDVQAAVSFQRDEFRDEEVPREMGGALSLGLTW